METLEVLIFFPVFGRISRIFKDASRHHAYNHRGTRLCFVWPLLSASRDFPAFRLIPCAFASISVDSRHCRVFYNNNLPHEHLQTKSRPMISQSAPSTEPVNFISNMETIPEESSTKPPSSCFLKPHGSLKWV